MIEFFLRHFIELLIVIPSAALAFLPFRNHLRIKLLPLALLTATVLIPFSAVGAWIAALRGIPSNIVLLPIMAVCFVFYDYIVEAPASQKVFCFLASAMLMAYVCDLTSYLLAPYEKDYFVFSVRSGLVCLGLSVLCVFAFWHSFAVELPTLLEDDRIRGNWWLLSVGPFAITLIFLWISPRDVEVVLAGRVRVVSVTLLLLFPVILFAVCHLCWKVAVRLSDAAQEGEENSLRQMEQKRYEELKDYMEETRALRHDFRQHLVVLSSLSEEGRMEELKDYVRQLTENAVVPKKSFFLNSAADAVAARYDDLASVLGVTIDWKLEIGDSLPVRDADFCSILGNLLENAVHAAAEEPEGKRRVSVWARMLSNAMLGLSVENPCSKEIVMRNGFPVSKEKDHGIGLTSISAIVRRNGGSFEIRTDGGVFAVNILLFFR